MRAMKVRPVATGPVFTLFRPAEILPERLRRQVLTAKQLVVLLKLGGGGAVSWHDQAVAFRTRHGLLRRRFLQPSGSRARCGVCLKTHERSVRLTADGEMLSLAYRLASAPVVR